MSERRTDGSGTTGRAVAPDPAAARGDVAAWRLLATLGTAGAVAGLLIVLAHQWAEPRIQAHRAEVLRSAIHEVLGAPDRYRTLYVLDGALVDAPPAGVDTAALDRVYAGFDGTGGLVGFAITGAEPGFQDVIRLIFGYDPRTERVLGMKVLESKETPGLGDKIEKDSAFVAGFRGAEAPLRGVKAGAGRDGHDVDMITGATISSRTVIGIINHRLDALRPVLGTHASGGGER